MPLFGPPNIEKMTAKKDVKGLIKALDYRKDASVPEAASLALIEIREPAIEPLIAALKGEIADVRKAAAQALVKIGEPAIDPLIAALKDYSVREGAAEVLGMMGAPALERAVERHMVDFKGVDDDARGDAFEALVEIGKPAAEPLMAALSDQNLDGRMMKISGIMVLAGNMEVIPHHADLQTKVIEILRDKGFPARGAAAGALGKIGDARAIEPLIAALKDEDIVVRWAAAGALFSFGDARTLESLSALDDDDLLLKGGSFLVLIGDARTVKPLITKLVDDDDEVRQSATAVLKKLGWKPA